MTVADQLFSPEVKLEKGRVFGYYECGPEWSWAPPEFVNYDLWYVFSGEGEMKLNGRMYSLRKGSCMMLQPGDMPVAEQNPSDRLTVLFIHFKTMDRQTNEATMSVPRMSSCIQLSDPSFLESMLLRLLDLCDSHSAWHEEEFDLLLKQVIIHLLRTDSEQVENQESLGLHAQAVRKLKSRIRADGGRMPSAKQIAAITGFAPAYVNRLFRKQTGLSIKQYGTKVKMERALHLMAETSVNVTQAALTLGYSDVYYFSKQFKQYFGVSPSAYRK